MASTTFLDRTLAPKAAFDLKCPKEQLHYQSLGGQPVGEQPTVDGDMYTLDRDVSRQQGVTGCGRQASFSYVHGVWVGNSTETAAP